MSDFEAGDRLPGAPSTSTATATATSTTATPSTRNMAYSYSYRSYKESIPIPGFEYRTDYFVITTRANITTDSDAEEEYEADFYAAPKPSASTTATATTATATTCSTTCATTCATATTAAYESPANALVWQLITNKRSDESKVIRLAKELSILRECDSRDQGA